MLFKSEFFTLFNSIVENIISFHFLPQNSSSCKLIPQLLDLDKTQRLFLYGVSDFLSKSSPSEQILVMNTCLNFLTQKIDAENLLSEVYPVENWSQEGMSLLSGLLFSFPLEKYRTLFLLNIEKAEESISLRVNRKIFDIGKTIGTTVFFPIEGQFLASIILRTWFYENKFSHDEGVIFIEYLSRLLAMDCLEKMEISYDFDEPLSFISRYIWNVLDDSKEDSRELQISLIEAIGEPSPIPDLQEDEFLELPIDVAIQYFSAAKIFMKDNGTNNIYPELYMLLSAYEKNVNNVKKGLES